MVSYKTCLPEFVLVFILQEEGWQISLTYNQWFLYLKSYSLTSHTRCKVHSFNIQTSSLAAVSLFFLIYKFNKSRMLNIFWNPQILHFPLLLRNWFHMVLHITIRTPRNFPVITHTHIHTNIYYTALSVGIVCCVSLSSRSKANWTDDHFNVCSFLFSLLKKLPNLTVITKKYIEKKCYDGYVSTCWGQLFCS